MAARLAKAVGQQGLVPSLGLVSGFFQVSFGARLMAELQSTGGQVSQDRCVEGLCLHHIL